ncbi:unnamed protein product [Acanthoscelides obtectus]|uniref:Uncharacterized protein n=1 Tax=Acanthoscelides obtectus TaxID=200917 RepID=A0A9P0Q8E4_ACAOB|nr:unnamed protein product [Acanthoscelides obtectus]CAK1627109.1 hypothetical protein AOBTE_LOCUS4310 [Acanthoscelides obtectus]
MLLQCLQQLNCLLSERCTNLNTYFQGHTFYHSRLQGHISRPYFDSRSHFKAIFQGCISRSYFKAMFQGYISRSHFEVKYAFKVGSQGRLSRAF